MYYALIIARWWLLLETAISSSDYRRMTAEEKKKTFSFDNYHCCLLLCEFIMISYRACCHFTTAKCPNCVLSALDKLIKVQIGASPYGPRSVLYGLSP